MIHAVEKCSKSTQILTFDNVPSNKTLETYPSFPRVFSLTFSEELIGDPSILFEKNRFSNITILSLWDVFFTGIGKHTASQRWTSSLPATRTELNYVEDDSEDASLEIAQIFKKIVEKCPKLISLSFGEKVDRRSSRKEDETPVLKQMETVKVPKTVKWLHIGWNASHLILDLRECELLLGVRFRGGKM